MNSGIDFRSTLRTCYLVLLWSMLLAAMPAIAASNAPVDSAASAQFPLTDPMAATVVGTPEKYQAEFPHAFDFSVRALEPLVARDTPATLRYARPLQYLLAPQDEPAPLAFVIAGTGSSALSKHCVLLSRILHAVGYSVACLPSPTTVTFMLGAAEHPVPGRMSADVRDLYRLMRAVREDLSDTLDIDGYALTGWSLGATQAAFLTRYDDRIGDFGFDRVLLINPAVNVWASVQRMDRLLEDNLEGGFAGIPAFVARGLGDLKRLYAGGQPLRFNQDFLYRAYRKNAVEDNDLAAIVGLAFRLALTNMAFAADQITQADVIVPRDVELGPYDSRGPYIRRSFEMSFSSYIDRLLLPYWNRDGRHLKRSRLLAEADLHRIRDYLSNNSRIAVFGNADDPILDAEEVGFLRDTFGERAFIGPHGGHLGNLDYRPTVDILQDYFSP